MGFLSEYIKSFSTKQRYSKHRSFLSVWDKKSSVSDNVYIAMGVRIVNSSVGKYTRLRHFCNVYHTTMGNFCGIGKDVKLGVGQHPTNLISTNLIFYKNNHLRNDWARPIEYQEYKPITIGNDVWIGEGAIVMGGVTIGDGAIVASRAIVTKDVPPYAIVAGLPAKVVKYRFDEDVIKRLLEIQWWDLPDDEIKRVLDIFTIPNITVKDIDKYFN